MRHASIPVLLALVLFGTAAEVSAQTPSCDNGTAQADLDINNVFARTFNTGSLFYGNQTNDGTGYIVPKAALHSSVFASGIWVGGKINGDLRVAGSRYVDFDFYPGPLGSNGLPVNPADCSEYDRIYSVSRIDIAAAEAGNISRDVREWPVELGAPVIDGDGNPDNYNFAGGDRPDIIGDQSLFWVMNDAGRPTHQARNTGVLGIEVRVQAFAFSRSDALGNTTFYKYTIINKGGQPITDTYVSVFADPDLGDFSDDFVGSDPEKGLGFVYNDNALDDQYGIPPAVGYDFFQGPIVDDMDGDGIQDTLGTSAISYFRNVAAAQPTSDPETGQEIYNYQQGLWKDATPMRARETGYGPQGGAPITKFMFPGDPVTNQTWSEVNSGGTPVRNPSGDRRFAIHTGPFRLDPNVPQEIVFGIIFGQGTSNLNSITVMRAADVLAQTAYDANFQIAPPPNSPPLCQEGSATLAPGSGNCLEAISRNGRARLVWGYPESDPNYLGLFEQEDNLLAGQNVPDNTYNFEGFNVYRYPTNAFAQRDRELVATFDRINGITTVIEPQLDPETGQTRGFVTARGTDRGVEFTYDITGVTNYTDYYYGVSAYAYNEFSVPQINESSPTNITVRPSIARATRATRSQRGDSLGVAVVGVQRGEGSVQARVVDPEAVTGDTYEVRFFRPANEDGSLAKETTYSVVNTTTGETVIDGQRQYTQTGFIYPQGPGVTVIDGVTFDIFGPEPGIKAFLTVANGQGALNPAESFSAEFQGFPFIDDPAIEAGPRPTARQQVGPALWLISQGGGANASYETWLARVLRGTNLDNLGANDYEWRFTGTSQSYRAFTDGGVLTVPFQLWDIGTTPSDPSDDVQLISAFLPQGCDSTAATPTPNDTPNAFDLSCSDSPISGNTNDPFTDWIYWYRPTNVTPGSAGYNAYFNADGTVNASARGAELFARTVLVNFNGGLVPGPYNQALPEPGTIFRIVTTKPNQPGDSFTFNTANLDPGDPVVVDDQTQLDRIAAVPNPYLGGSTYEAGNVDRVVRFTNLPESQVTIRIFTVSGSLVRTLIKDGSARSLDWNLQTSNNLPVASGMYLVHVDVASSDSFGGGERTLKLAVINRRTQIRAF